MAGTLAIIRPADADPASDIVSAFLHAVDTLRLSPALVYSRLLVLTSRRAWAAAYSPRRTVRSRAARLAAATLTDPSLPARPRRDR